MSDNENKELVELEESEDGQKLNEWNKWFYEDEEDDSISEKINFRGNQIDLNFEKFKSLQPGNFEAGDVFVDLWVNMPACCQDPEFIANFQKDKNGSELKAAKEQKINQLIKKFEMIIADLKLAKDKL